MNAPTLSSKFTQFLQIILAYFDLATFLDFRYKDKFL